MDVVTVSVFLGAGVYTKSQKPFLIQVFVSSIWKQNSAYAEFAGSFTFRTSRRPSAST